MNLQQYLKDKEVKKSLLREEKKRNWCFTCFRSKKVCLCSSIKSFDSLNRYIFLMHPKEFKKQKNGTGRLAIASLKNSLVIVGVNFTDNNEVNKIISSDEYEALILYPGINAWNLDQVSDVDEKRVPKKRAIFILDATWPCAKTMMRLSTNLRALPKVSFETNRESSFTIKHQPHKGCLSTAESVVLLIEKLNALGLEKTDGQEKAITHSFEEFVKFQIRCATDPDIPSSRGVKQITTELESSRIRTKKNRLFYWDDDKSLPGEN